MEVVSCPTPGVWERYVLGQVDEAEQHTLDAHLAHCPTCLERLKNLPGEDTLVSDLRTRLSLPTEPPDAAADQVIRSAIALQGDPTRPWVGGQSTPTELGEYLTPPQEADEIGRLAQFRVLKVLGRGGMGLVLLAEDTTLRRHVALKVLSPVFARRRDAAPRFLREAQAAAAIRHEHVVTIYQVGEADTPSGTVPFLAMELLEGVSLGTALEQRDLSLREIVRIGREVAEGLAAAHKSGLIHRDVKLDNIFLEKISSEDKETKVDTRQASESPSSLIMPSHPASFRVKLLDFGLAREVRVESQLTEYGVIVGTPAFMAPEQAAGKPVDARADLFSLGCVLYRMCTGQLPFPTTDVMTTLNALATMEPTPVRQVNPAVPRALADLIHSLLSKTPEKRPASAQVVAKRLGELERQLTGASPRTGWWTLRRVAILVVTLAIIDAAALAVVILRGQNTQNQNAEYVINTDDPDIVFRADGKGGVLLEDKKADRRYQLKIGKYDPTTGEYEIDVSDPIAGLQFSTKTLTIKRGDKVALKASLRALESGGLPAGVTGIDADWVAKVAQLPADEQVLLVTAKLRKLNPGFDSPVTPHIEKGVVVGLEFATYSVTNIAPVRGLPGLRELKMLGYHDKPGKVTDLRPLTGMPLRGLSVFGNIELSDLRPLTGMPLVELNCYGTAVFDLTPIQKCPIEDLNVGSSSVVSLSAVKTLPLKRMHCNDLKSIADLEPLAGKKLVELECGNCPLLKDISPLKGMPLESLNIFVTAVTDLSILKDAPLKKLIAEDGPVIAHRKLLQAIPTLEQLNSRPVQDYWANLDAKKQPEKRP
jgi:serine/threonine protein kinase